jgi:hypothetical protein
MRLLVCGGRDYTDREFIFETLDQLHADREITTLIHGAARGADTLAGEWAIARSVEVTPYPADWRAHGNLAGPIRNRRMLHEGKPDRVLAFPGGVGTAHMVRIARAFGVPVRAYTW